MARAVRGQTKVIMWDSPWLPQAPFGDGWNTTHLIYIFCLPHYCKMMWNHVESPRTWVRTGRTMERWSAGLETPQSDSRELWSWWLRYLPHFPGFKLTTLSVDVEKVKHLFKRFESLFENLSCHSFSTQSVLFEGHIWSTFNRTWVSTAHFSSDEWGILIENLTEKPKKVKTCCNRTPETWDTSNIIQWFLICTFIYHPCFEIVHNHLEKK